jgi:hypothetical protein
MIKKIPDLDFSHHAWKETKDFGMNTAMFGDKVYTLKDKRKTVKSIFARKEAIEYYLNKKEFTKEENIYIQMQGGFEVMRRRVNILNMMLEDLDTITGESKCKF